ncbi:phage repressor protein CI [Rosenbergiella epipactidis]|uniref:phage repressor protein CI n=1 Tax=Rosenbergiella epipactidis TaxID=1544694 RepID=UPI001BDADA3C|nr:phage repressor protein CI [Rosenbergiella epipactidis]MBT0719442.1 phage repressor protein CI [Rosenbergiella epipactidis]
MDIESQISAEEVLDRICQTYGFTQKIQLANHFDIAASTLQNRYSRGNVSYDFAAFCSLETGVNIQWLLTGQGLQFQNEASNSSHHLELFTLSEGRITKNGIFSVGTEFFPKPLKSAICLKTENKSYIVEKDAPIADGTWVVDVDGAVSIRELTVLPGRKVHVAGGKVPFECGIEQIKTIGRVVGVYNEVN